MVKKSRLVPPRRPVPFTLKASFCQGKITAKPESSSLLLLTKGWGTIQGERREFSGILTEAFGSRRGRKPLGWIPGKNRRHKERHACRRQIALQTRWLPVARIPGGPSHIAGPQPAFALLQRQERHGFRERLLPESTRISRRGKRPWAS